MLHPCEMHGKVVTTKLTVDASGDVGDLTGIPDRGGQVLISCRGGDAIVKFGSSASVSASTAYSGDDLPEGNFPVLAGSIQVVQAPPGTTHVSVIKETDSAADGVIFLTPCKGM